nr:MAG TPA: hypothetical protein [Caudoviricetes sp.]
MIMKVKKLLILKNVIGLGVLWLDQRLIMLIYRILIIRIVC